MKPVSICRILVACAVAPLFYAYCRLRFGKPFAKHALKGLLLLASDCIEVQ